MALSAELRLDAELDAVPRARRFTAQALTKSTPHQAADAELVVTELVTNAVLHGQAPIVLRLRQIGAMLRVEVEDRGHELPVRPRPSSDAMTGRGLALVGAVAARWGAAPVEGKGKVVWAELPASGHAGSALGYRPEIDAEALLAARDDGLQAQDDRVAVRVGAVPTMLLLEAKAHIDNVVRELTLLRALKDTDASPVPPAVARLAQAATEDFAEARAGIKRQALAAAERGELVTHLTLDLPLSAAEAGERYLDALDEMDRYARSARLLTLAPPAAHRAFRRWYVGAIIEQLRAHAAGKEAPPPTEFYQMIADEVNRLSALEETAERLELLQKVTAELGGARSEDEIAHIVADNAGRYLGVETARVFVRTDRGTLRSLAWHGGPSAEEQARDAYAEFSVDADLPGALVARTGEPIFRRSLAEIYATLPIDPTYYPSERSLHLVPANIGDRNLGLLVLTILGGTVDEDAQHRFVRSLADALAHALDRARAMARATQAAERLTFLADMSIRLSASLEVSETLDAVCDLMVPRFADWCVVHLLRDGSLETAALRHADPARTAWARSLRDRYPTPMDAPTGVPAVVRTGLSEVYPSVSPELIRSRATNDEHGRLLAELGIVSGLIVPLPGRSGVVGSITLIQAESDRHYSADDLPFVEDVGRRAALALETADLFTQQSGQLARVTRVAEAAQLAILSPPPPQIGSVALAATYVSAAADALVGGDLYEVVEHEQSVRLLIGDVRGKGLAAVRLATVALGEFRAAAADLDDLSQVAQQLDRRVRRYLGEEDFITALVAEVHDDGSYAIVSCGHPAPLRTSDGKLVEIAVEPSVPLGLGAQPVATVGRLDPGDRLVLFTDGIIEARDPQRRFVDLALVMQPIAESALDNALDEVLCALRSVAGADLDDDIALLVAEYRPGS